MSGGETTWSETSGCEMSRSKTSGGETSWERNSRSKKVRGRNFLVRCQGAKCTDPKCQGAKRPCPKCQEVKRPGPKCQGAKRPVHDVLLRTTLRVEGRTALTVVCRFTYIATLAIPWQFPQTYKHLALSLPAESSRNISIGTLITP